MHHHVKKVETQPASIQTHTPTYTRLGTPAHAHPPPSALAVLSPFLPAWREASKRVCESQLRWCRRESRWMHRVRKQSGLFAAAHASTVKESGNATSKNTDTPTYRNFQKKGTSVPEP